jgi:hypothetical protein
VPPRADPADMLVLMLSEMPPFFSSEADWLFQVVEIRQGSGGPRNKLTGRDRSNQMRTPRDRAAKAIRIRTRAGRRPPNDNEGRAIQMITTA